MTVKELIECLEQMPSEKKVFHIWDGEPRSEIQFIWETESGIMTADSDEIVYTESFRPLSKNKMCCHI